VLFVPLGGIDQWISIRGENHSNPVLLVIHGGPGEAQWPQAECICRGSSSDRFPDQIATDLPKSQWPAAHEGGGTIALG
jgi:hypothetical protein